MELDSEEIKTQLKTLMLGSLRMTGVSPETLNDDMRLLDGDWELDSVDILQLIIDIEKHFGIKLVSGRFDRSAWQTINSLAAAIQAKIKDSRG